MDNIFNKIIKGKTVLLGVGNILKGDDAFGPRLAEILAGEGHLICIDAGSAPENYLGKIAREKPDTVIIADAVHMDAAPGTYDILHKDEIVRSGFTTHDLSPVMAIEYLEQETKADIYMLAVQPGNVAFGEEMSDSVKKALGEIVAAIKKVTSEQ